MIDGIYEEMNASYTNHPFVGELMETSKRSLVTEKIFESWENTPPLRDRKLLNIITKNVMKMEEKEDKKYENIANELGWMTDRLKTQLQKHVERLTKESNIFRMTSLDALNGLLNINGRYLTQFETGSSNGTFDKKLRAYVEAVLFGFNCEADTNVLTEESVTDDMLQINSDRRPVYGYLSDDINGVVLQRETDLVGNLDFYGEVAVKLKRNRIDTRTTVTFKDSLSKDDIVPSPLTSPHFLSMGVPNGVLDGRSTLERVSDVGTTSRPKWGELYAEAQIHGQVTWEDVESVHLSSKEVEKIYVAREIIDRFNRSHPKSQIKLIVY